MCIRDSIGVDVFFVISGYLITSIIKREIERGEFTFMGFYARRARRILPALLVVLLFSSIVGLFVLLPSDLERYAKSVIAALLSVSNFWFWSQGGYFGAASEMAPLLHTWSLAVEEQFYILLPIALLLLYRWAPRRVGMFTLVACLGTFAASAWFVSKRTPEVFFFSPFRAWELLLGSLLALHQLPVIVGNLRRQWIAGIGLLLIVVPAFVYSSETVFPGPAAALPSIGAALLIWTGASGETVTSNILKTNVLVFFGLISYSLYLWHWPLLVFARHALGEHLGLGVRLGIGFASVVLAAFSLRFIETPFRSRVIRSKQQILVFSVATTVLLGCIVAIVAISHGLPSRYPPEVVVLDRARLREIVRGECIDIRVPLNLGSVCHIGAKGEPIVLVWGDSYAHSMLPAFDKAFRNMGVAALFVAESGCPPLPEARISFKGRDNWRCREFNAKVSRFVKTQTGLSKIVLAAAWDAYLIDASGYKLSGSGKLDSASILKQGTETLASQLQADGITREIIVVGQVPAYDWSVPHKMLLSRLKGEPIVPLRHEEWREKSAISRGIFEQLEISREITFINSAEWFCSSGTCRYSNEAGNPLYWDGGHINIDGIIFIMPMLERALGARLRSAG